MDILLYGIVGDSWDGLDAKTLVPQISDGSDDLNVRINSPGGYVMEGLAILNAITREKAKGRKVIMHIDGLAASMASVIAMVGDEVIMADNALMMIHNPWDVAVGDAAELRAAADKLDKIRDQLVGIYSARTGLSADELIPMLDAETWLTAQDALEQNFITSISEAVTVSACDVSAFGFRKAPEDPRIVKASAVGAGFARALAAKSPPIRENEMPQGNDPADDKKPADTITAADAQARIDAALATERTRVTTINMLCSKRLLDGGLATDVTDDFSAAQDEETPAETVSAPGGGKSPTSKADEGASDTKDKAKG